MEWINGILNNFINAFSFENLAITITDPSNWMIILSLVVMEGFLSADNALVLAMMVRHLPEKQQRKALRYGIWGAYAFRMLAIAAGVYLIRIWWIKLIAAVYLMKLSLDYFLAKKSKGDNSRLKTMGKSFWGTILTVELMDVAFSIDSVIAAFGISEQLWVLFLGAVFGILMMRGVAQLFVRLIDKTPELETGAYLLVAFIGLKMIAELSGWELPDYVFFGVLVSVFSGVFLIHHYKR